MEVKVRYKEKEIKAKKEEIHTLLKKTNKIWNSCNCSSSNKIGSLVNLLKESKCKTYNEWEEHFFDKLDGANKILSMYKSFYKYIKDNNIECSKQNIIDLIIIRTIYETWIGSKEEDVVEEWLLNQEEVSQVRHSNNIEDFENGIDFVVFLKNNNVIGVQSKPMSFFNDCTFGDNSKAKVLLKKMRKFNCLDIFIVMMDGDRVTNFTQSQWNRYKQYWLKGERKHVV